MNTFIIKYLNIIEKASHQTKDVVFGNRCGQH
jgi:hypothetical protein